MKMNQHKPYLLFVLVVIFGMMFLSCGGTNGKIDVEMHKKLAGELRNNKLYQPAIDEYEKCLADYTIEKKSRANLNYLIGKIYFEDLKNYEQAAAYYLKARELNPEASFNATASKNLVAAFEKMGRMLDAKRELDATTNIDHTPKKNGDVEVARIGEQPVWLSEIEQQIQLLPVEVQKQLVNRDEKIKFVRQYIGLELMYRAAVRENYIDQPQVKAQLRHFEKNLLIEKYVGEKIMPGIKIDSSDVYNYYKANQDKRYKNSPYDSVRSQVFMDYQNEKMEFAYTDYINSLAAVEKVQFLDHNVK